MCSFARSCVLLLLFFFFDSRRGRIGVRVGVGVAGKGIRCKSDEERPACCLYTNDKMIMKKAMLGVLFFSFFLSKATSGRRRDGEFLMICDDL